MLCACVAQPPPTTESPAPRTEAAAGDAQGGRRRPAEDAPPPKPARSPRPAASDRPAPLRTAPPPLRQARSAAEVAQVLAAAEAAIRDPDIRSDDLARAGHTQQRVYRLLARRSDLRRGVVARMPRALRPAVRRNIAAGAALSSLVTPQKKLPDWRIVAPAPAPALVGAYQRAAAEFGLEWEYLAAINLVETRMGRIRGRSTAGAQGPMQFMPQTWAAYGRGDINDPRDAITAAARYLAASGAPQDMAGALFAYNRSHDYVEAVSAYAEVMRADPRAYRGYYHWQVYFATPRGDVLLPVGYGS